MNEKCNLFSLFIYKNFEKIGFKSRDFGQTDRYRHRELEALLRARRFVYVLNRRQTVDQREEARRIDFYCVLRSRASYLTQCGFKY